MSMLAGNRIVTGAGSMLPLTTDWTSTTASCQSGSCSLIGCNIPGSAAATIDSPMEHEGRAGNEIIHRGGHLHRLARRVQTRQPEEELTHHESGCPTAGSTRRRRSARASNAHVIETAASTATSSHSNEPL